MIFVFGFSPLLVSVIALILLCKYVEKPKAVHKAFQLSKLLCNCTAFCIIHDLAS